MQLDLAKMLANCVQGECKPSQSRLQDWRSKYDRFPDGLLDILVITQCSVEALYKLGKDYQAITNLAKTFERRRCNHREAIEEHLCIKDVVGMLISLFS